MILKHVMSGICSKMNRTKQLPSDVMETPLNRCLNTFDITLLGTYGIRAGFSGSKAGCCRSGTYGRGGNLHTDRDGGEGSGGSRDHLVVPVCGAGVSAVGAVLCRVRD